MYGNFDKPFTFDRVVRLVISLALIIFGLYTIYLLRSVLLPFLVAWLIAYMLNPVVRFCQKKLCIRNRALAVTLTLLMVVGLITLLVILLIPLIEKEVFQINSLIYNYQSRLGNLSLNINGIPVKLQDFILNNIDFTKLREALSKQNAAETLQFAIPAVTGVVSNTISAILSLTIIFLVLLYLIFILLDYDKINALWQTLIPARYLPQVRKVVQNVEKNMNIYFRHQFFICLILCVLYAVGFQLIGLPLAIMLGIFVGLLHMVPYMQIISFVPALLLCWLKAAQTDQSFWVMIGLVALIYLVVQCVLDLFLVPKIMGKAMGLNPAIILLSLSVWGYLLGIVGMIIAIPLTTLLLSYYQSFIASIPDKMEKTETE
ncbi:MAG: AI-2E family transporter [Prevotella sp.]|jgi:predicted PurR-regulated permease PerM|nr:AI-2E family transporter [Prevotella sp.]